MASVLFRLSTALVVATLCLPVKPVAAAWYFVGPNGSDAAAGRSAKAPVATIQKGLDLAEPGDAVVLLPGTYRQDVDTVRAGEPDAPIRIQGPPDAVVQGAGDNYVFDIRHDHIELIGFTIDGLHGDGDAVEDYRDKLIYAHGQDVRNGITGVRVLGMSLTNAYGECLRLKTGARANEVAYSHIATCGVRDFKFSRDRKNGEAIYIGTAPEQLPDDAPGLDASRNNHVHHNFLRPEGSECVDIKEGATDNLIEHNTCVGQVDPDSGGISVRGNANTIRHNAVGPTVGAGIRLGGDTASDGINNRVYGNQLQYNEAGSLKLMRLPQARVCGNDIRQPARYQAVRFDNGEYRTTPDTCPPNGSEE